MFLQRVSESVFSRLMTFPPIIHSVKKDRLSFLGKIPLLQIYETVKQIEKNQLPGVFIEAGTALGGSAIVILSAKSKQRPFFIYDVFGTIPPPSADDGDDVKARYEVISQGDASGLGGDKYYGYEEDLLLKVSQNLQSYQFSENADNYRLIKGLFADTLIVDQPVAFAHLDGDWYESTYTCLQTIWDQMSNGGIVIIDDYFHWSGCRKAVNAFFRNRSDHKFIYRSRLHVLKQR